MDIILRYNDSITDRLNFPRHSETIVIDPNNPGTNDGIYVSEKDAAVGWPISLKISIINIIINDNNNNSDNYY